MLFGQGGGDSTCSAAAGNDTLVGRRGLGHDVRGGAIGRGPAFLGGDGFDYARYDEGFFYGDLVINLADALTQNTGYRGRRQPMSGSKGGIIGVGNDSDHRHR